MTVGNIQKNLVKFSRVVSELYAGRQTNRQSDRHTHHNTLHSSQRRSKSSNKKHLKNVGPIRHCEPPHATCFTLPFTRCRYCRTPPLSHAACASMSTATTTTTTTTTTRDRGDRYGPIEWAQLAVLR